MYFKIIDYEEMIDIERIFQIGRQSEDR